MSMINAKSLENTLQQFYKERGREPTFEEFRQLIRGLKVPKDEPK